MKIEKCTVKFHYVKTYPNWKTMICKIIKVKPLFNFYVELDFFVEGHIEFGDFIRFDNGLQAKIVDKIDGQISENKDIIKYKCYLFKTLPVSYFDWCFKSVQVIGRTKGE